ncbi:WD40 repeat domain-containing protein [Candidatus Flexifilum breve]|uniref:WD40 repeat domain-containing protein n=1 Tax=Candidatus Flexifilum breve TaxID=3140694 RepID=UPI00331305D8
MADHESHRLEGHIGEVQSVAFSPDGRFLASASVDLLLQSEDGNVIIWGYVHKVYVIDANAIPVRK